MRLADFIEGDMEAILCEWEAFSSMQMPAAIGMNSEALRDHAEEILRFRGEQARNRAENDGSLGLGLYIASEIAIAHGGDIAVRSDEQKPYLRYDYRDCQPRCIRSRSGDDHAIAEMQS